MKSRRALLKKSQVYLILDRIDLASGLSKFNFFGTKPGIVQLRDKVSGAAKIIDFALKLSKYYRKTKTLFIVNNDIRLAEISQADGVHLGQNDLALSSARKILGQDKLIGISCGNLSQALKAQAAGADYLGIGPIFKTPLKPRTAAIGLNVLRSLKEKIKIPYFAIGNIGINNLDEIIATKTQRIALCRAVLDAPNPKLAVKLLLEKLK